jgi:16S rRNA pseudouridine516 synthase
MKQTIRLDKMLSRMGYGTRTEVRKAVKSGKVRVNGLQARDSGMQVRPGEDEVAWDGSPVIYREWVYYMMNKPSGVISATEDPRHRTVLDLLRPEDRVADLFPAGRLDKDTEGLLLLTNDGKLAHQLLSPRKHVPKTYFAVVAGEVDESEIARFASGICLDDGYLTLPAKLTVQSVERDGNEVRSNVELTLTEGKFHQVKRMFAAVGKSVVYLKRVGMGPLALDAGLAPGEYRPLTEEELARLKQHDQQIGMI